MAGYKTHVISQHESSSLDDKLVGFLISDHGCGQTCSTARLPTGVHGPGTELLDMPTNTQTRLHTGPERLSSLWVLV